jgi:hypothetical protein
MGIEGKDMKERTRIALKERTRIALSETGLIGRRKILYNKFFDH